jgi:hypothetical protein
MFAAWPHREALCSTLSPLKALETLEGIFRVVSAEYDVAVAPHCSKMQGIAAYLFWRRHPEVQLLFTSPARFNPKQYSRGERDVYIFNLTKTMGDAAYCAIPRTVAEAST